MITLKKRALLSRIHKVDHMGKRPSIVVQYTPRDAEDDELQSGHPGVGSAPEDTPDEAGTAKTSLHESTGRGKK